MYRKETHENSIPKGITVEKLSENHQKVGK
jgi:hypothetical protein